MFEKEILLKQENQTRHEYARLGFTELTHKEQWPSQHPHFPLQHIYQQKCLSFLIRDFQCELNSGTFGS